MNYIYNYVIYIYMFTINPSEVGVTVFAATSRTFSPPGANPNRDPSGTALRRSVAGQTAVPTGTENRLKGYS